jgi:hypothetical protein
MRKGLALLGMFWGDLHDVLKFGSLAQDDTPGIYLPARFADHCGLAVVDTSKKRLLSAGAGGSEED